MFLTTLASLAVAIASASAIPYGIPTTDGFPFPSPTQLASIERIAGGSLPGGALPTSLKAAGITTLQLLSINEQFEVAFFESLLQNITRNQPGYDLGCLAPFTPGYVIETLEAVIAQEKLHAIGVNGILKSAGQKALSPCKYQFPVDTFQSAITLANTFTDIALSILPAAQSIFTTDGADEDGIVPILGSVIGQEGEQNGFYRLLQKKRPSSAPFLTLGSTDFAFTVVQQFLVPGSCPFDVSSIDLKTYGALTVLTPPQATNMDLHFEVSGNVNAGNNSVVYLFGQNLPFTVPIEHVRRDATSGKTYFTARFPFEEAGFAQGLTFAAVVNGKGNFTNIDAVAAATVFGPGLIEVD